MLGIHIHRRHFGTRPSLQAMSLTGHKQGLPCQGQCAAEWSSEVCEFARSGWIILWFRTRIEHESFSFHDEVGIDGVGRRVHDICN